MDELDKVMAEYNKETKGSIVKLKDLPYNDVPRISTGSFALDIATGGGFTHGSVVEFFGEESTGKSLVGLETVAEVQKKDKRKCVYIDLEGSITLKWAVKVGVDPELLYIARPKTAEDALEMVEKLANSGEAGVIVIDSVAALVPNVEAENELEKQQMGTAAKLMSKHLRRLTSILHPNNLADKENYNPCVVIYINQTREKIGVVWGNPLTTPGGKALKFYSSVRVHFKRGEVLRDDKKNVIGQQIKFETKKNKTYKPFQVGILSFYTKGYIDNEASIVDYAIVYELIKQKGAWCYFEDETYQGKEKLIEYLKSQPKKLTKLKKDILDLVSKE